MEAAVNTFIGDEEKAKEPEKATASPQPAADLDAAAATTAVNPVPGGFDMAAQIDTLSGELGDATLIAPHSFAAGLGRDDQKMVETLLNPATDADGVEFDVSLTDSVFLGEPMVPPEFDIGSINLDLAAQPAPAEAAALTSTEVTPAASAHDAQWEEVNTKLDLAKAYEEMGDLEGARELLQEVLTEGSPELVEQAKAVLARIGE
jgi:pilus assembly protein FimV